MLMVWYKVVMVQKPQAEGVNKNKPSETNIEVFFLYHHFLSSEIVKAGLCGNSLRP